MARKRRWTSNYRPSGESRPSAFVSEAAQTWPHVKSALFPGKPPSLSPKYSRIAPHVTPADVEAILSLTTTSVISTYLNHTQAAIEQWTGIPPVLVGSFPKVPSEPEFKPARPLSDEPQWSEFSPERPTSHLRALIEKLSGNAERRRLNALRNFSAAQSSWVAERERIEAERTAHHKKHEEDLANYRKTRESIEQELSSALEEFRSERANHLLGPRAEIENVRATAARANEGDVEAIEKLAELVFFLSPYPSAMSKNIDCAYDPQRHILVLRVEVPNFEIVPLLDELKTKNKPVSAARRRQLQELAVHSICLRSAYEIFRCREFGQVSTVVTNGLMQYHEKTKGHLRTGIVASLIASRNSMEDIDIRNIDAKSCFRALKGLHVPNWDHIVPIPPSIDFDKNDKRIVEAEEILGALPQGTNLARIEWDDFEHLVRELFEREYTSQRKGVEVKVTRASRDWGVDAIVFDPDPLHGGRIVIQAKRYNNLVGVNAVRDLYGTVMNEGANRGILVTTSSFGPDSYEFAKGKPLTLLDGANLLALFEKHGYRDFRIDLREATPDQ